jgi:integrase/recombinase XerC
MSGNGSPVSTVKSYGTDLRMLHAHTGDLLSTQEFEDGARQYLNYNRNEGSLSPSSIRRKLAAFRAYGVTYGETVLVRYKVPPQAPARPHPVKGGADSVFKLAEMAHQPHHKALIGLCGFAGLRVGEAIAVTAADFTISDEITLKVFGNGYKTRYLPIGNAAWGCVARSYLNALASGGPLVPMTNRAARRVITDIGKRIGLDVSSHDLRSTFATEVYETTKDILIVQDLLGHANVDTTRGYTAVNATEKKRAVEFHGR